MKYYYLIKVPSTHCVFIPTSMEKLLGDDNLVEINEQLSSISPQACRVVIQDKLYTINKQYIDLTRKATLYILHETNM